MSNPVLSHPSFHDEEAAFQWVESIVWPQGPVCPHCGAASDHVGKLLNQRTKASKANPQGKPIHGLYKCYACRQPFTVRIGTIFEASHAPLHLWMQAMYLLCSSKKGISTNQLRRTLGVHMKTAWHMSHRIRLAMDGSSGTGPIGGAGKIVEADETFITRSPKSRRPKDAPAREDRQVMSLVERGGALRSVYLDHGSIRDALWRHLDRDSTLHTDGSVAYRRFVRNHAFVDHSKQEWVREEPDGTKVHTNTLEGFFSIFKRGLVGVYQHVDERHLHRYLAEFDFRYNNRLRLGISDEERTDRAIRGIVGKRLTYRETVDAKKAEATK
jgi:transposase-like protein